MRLLNTFIIGALIGAAPAVSWAQEFGTGTGFPIGDKSRIHTGLDLGIVFDSNSLRLDNANTNEGQKSDWKGVIRPSVAVNVPGTSLELDLLGQVSIMRYLGTGGLDQDDFSDTTFGGDVTAKLRLGSKDSFIGFSLENQFVRTPVFLDTPGTIPSDERRFPLWHNRGQALFTLRPGGRALEFDLGYGILINGYDGDTTLPTGITHSGIFEARWKFFPKTALLFHADVGYFSAYNDTGADNGSPTTFSSIPIHVYLGAIGQVTTKLNAEITVGYGDTLSSEGGNFTTRGPIGNIILTYAFSERTALSLGYRRRVMPEVVLNSFSSDAPFVRFTMGLAGRLSLSLFGEYQFRKYARSGSTPDGERADVQIAIGDAKVEYWFFPWLNASLGYRLQMQNPESGLMLPDNVFFQDFVRHQVMLGVGLRY